MKATETFEENPANSLKNVMDVLDARLNFEHKGVPTSLSSFLKLLGSEKEECGGVKAIKGCMADFDRWRKGLPGPKSQTPTLTEFVCYLFSPIFNSPKIVQETDRPGTNQVVSVDLPGPSQVVPVNLQGTSQVVTVGAGGLNVKAMLQKAFKGTDSPSTSHVVPLDHPGTSQVVTPAAAGPTVDATLVKTLKVKIYLGIGWKIDFPMLDEGSPPDLFVKVSIIPKDKRKKEKTEVQKNNWEPIWGKEFEFPSCPDNASILFEVYDRDRISKNDFAGKISLRVSELSMGIRAVPLYDEEGNQCAAARLLVRFMIV